MGNRFGVPSNTLMIGAAVLLLPTFIQAQTKPSFAAKADTKTAPAKSPEKKTWVLPRTPDGQPNLQGYWTSLSFTPMERPAKYGNREFLTDEEAVEIHREGIQHSYEFTFNDLAETPVYDATVYALSAWQEGVAPNKRTSLVVYPADGKIPALTPEAAKVREAARRHGPNQDYADPNAPVKADSAEDLNLGERCLSFGGPPILPGAYNSNFHIIQSRENVLIEYEWANEPRIIPLDGSPHVSSSIHPWHGDS